jgi:hypothetical protein
VASGRNPDGALTITALEALSPGQANPAPLVRGLVINEIMYHPISGEDDDQYIELCNRSGSVVSLAGWRGGGDQRR